MKIILRLVILGLVATSCCAVSPTKHNGKNGDAAGRALLRKHLFNDYDKINIPDDVTVKFGMSVLSLDIDEDKDVLKVGSWMKYTWTDSRLQWDNTTNHINVLRLGAHEIWKPDITLYNNAKLNKDMTNCWNSNPIVYPTGKIIWIPPCEIQSFCNLTLDRHPYGEQKCDLKFGSWTYDSEMLDLDFFETEKQADLQEFSSKDWRITSNTAVRNEKIYPCCPDEAYADITFTLGFQRTELNTCRSTK